MAYFKLSLLTPNIQVNKTTYSQQIISEFYSNTNKSEWNTSFKTNNAFCYSSNENFSIHKNNDKDLSFTMLEKVFSQLGEWVINPFTSHLHIGSQILLEDQFHEYHVFTIKDIWITIKFRYRNRMINLSIF